MIKKTLLSLASSYIHLLTSEASRSLALAVRCLSFETWDMIIKQRTHLCIATEVDCNSHANRACHGSVRPAGYATDLLLRAERPRTTLPSQADGCPHLEKARAEKKVSASYANS